MKTLELTADRSGERLDVFLARRCPELSRSYAQRLISESMVTVAGRATKPSQLIASGERVVVRIPPPEPLELTP